MNTFAATIIAAAACIGGLAAVPASAEDAGAIRVQVDRAGLDIGSDVGAARFADRIEANVARACARPSEGRQLKLVSACKEQLLSAAVEQLESKGADLVAGHLARG